MMTPPLRGARYLLRGMQLITLPSLRPFVLIPLAINTLVFALAIAFGAAQFGHLMDLMDASIPSWLSWLEWILWPLFILVLLVVVFYTFTLVANLIGAPFNSLLAEKVEQELTGRAPDEQSGIRRQLLELPITLLDEVKKILYALLFALPFLLLLFVPVVGPFLWLAYTAWMLAVEYCDYPMGNHGLKFKQMRIRLRRRWSLSLGFGAAATGLSMVPVLNFILMPSAVAGATAMWVRELQDAD